VGYAYADQNSDQVALLEVDSGDGCVAPTPDTIASGDYPLARDLYIYVNLDKAAESEALTAFVDFFLSDEGIAAVTEADYIALAQSALDETRADWAAR
jgi:phosphate transport system substrate-binding protein